MTSARAWMLFRSGRPVSGLALAVVWATGAGIILVGAPPAAAAMLGDGPFGEKCDAWCAGEKGVARLAAGDVEWYRVDLQRCPTCGQMNTASVLREKLKVDDRGNVGVDSSAFIENLLLTAPEADSLRALNRDLAAPAFASKR